jgi:serralysin
MVKAFTIDLTSDQEVPFSDSTARGFGTVVWDETANTAEYRITVSGLDFVGIPGTTPETPETTDDVISMHVHNEARGAAGPVVFGQINPAQDNDDLTIEQQESGAWTISGIWELTDPASVPISSFAELLNAADRGEDVPLYFNIHTPQFPTGAIRGQWVALAEGETAASAAVAFADAIGSVGQYDIATAVTDWLGGL